MSNLEDLGEPSPKKCEPEAGPSEDSAGQLLVRKRLRIPKTNLSENRDILRSSRSRILEGNRGKKKESEVAVRKIRTADCQENWLDIIQKHQDGFLKHNNVVKVFGFDENLDRSWRYFAVELFHATLEQFCNRQYTGPMPSDVI